MTVRQLIRSLAEVPLSTGFAFPATAQKAPIPGGLVHEAEFQRDSCCHRRLRITRANRPHQQQAYGILLLLNHRSSA